MLLSLLLYTPTAHAAAAQAMMSISPTQGPPGTVISITGSGWQPGEGIRVDLASSGRSTTVTASPRGNWTAALELAGSGVAGNFPGGRERVQAQGLSAGESAEAIFRVTNTSVPSAPQPGETAPLRNCFEVTVNNTTQRLSMCLLGAGSA
ncbi:hypothetical protein GCM10009753_13450 [Streptantibioticus ferralitis]